MADNWFGTKADTYSDPFLSGVTGDINSLRNSNAGAQGAATAERAIGRRYSQRQEQIESDPNYGRNAAVSGKLHDMALSEVGGETSDAYVKGAATDLNAKREAAQLGLSASQQSMQINELNHQREQESSFGNSFVGGLLKSAIGFGVGGLAQAGIGAAAKAFGGGSDSGDNSSIGKSGGLQFNAPGMDNAGYAARGIHGSDDEGAPWMPGYGAAGTY